jgi:hypothetical protein
MFSSVKYSPCDLSRVSFHELCRFALRVQKCKHLLVNKTNKKNSNQNLSQFFIMKSIVIEMNYKPFHRF